MKRQSEGTFTTIQTEGAILPSDLLQRIVEGDKELPGLRPEDYHLTPNEKLNEAINRSWNRLIAVWLNFHAAVVKTPHSEPGTTLTRERWLLPLFQELGYGRLVTSKAIEINGRTYPISHTWQNTPIHLVGFRVDLDKRTAGIAGAARTSPHSLLQEFLNHSENYMWGFVSNGYKLRILRDNVTLTRQAYVEFDLEAMFNGQVYADFVILWLLCHQSRVEGEKPEECWLEKWSKIAHEQGTRALDQLRDGVEEAIKALGRGFLSHPANATLREKLKSGELTTQDYYRQLLRVVYRLLFLFVAEDRGLLLDPKASEEARKRFNLYYSTSRFRRLAGTRRGTRHSDLYHGLVVVMDKLGSDKGCPELGLPALGSFLWSPQAVQNLISCEISNHDFLDVIRALAFTTDAHIRRSTDYKNLGSEELGSVYESLLELHPDVNIPAGTFELKIASGHERKSTGSYYTPSSLIQCLLDTALDPVIQEALKKENPEAALLNLKVCDPACGSGHFLIAAAHRIARKLASVRTGDAEPSPEATRTALRDVIGHCIYGVDVNEMAVELCKVALWMEALEPGKPLSFLDHRIQCGNSLLGTTPALLANGIPDEAFTPIEGDDKSVATALKKKNKEERGGQMALLFDSEPAPSNNFSENLTRLDSIDDATMEGIRQKQERYEQLAGSAEYRKARLVADAWCAAFVWKKMKNAPEAVTQDVLRRFGVDPTKVPVDVQNEIARLAQQYKFLHWHLAFPDVFRIPLKDDKPDNEQAGWSGGFDVVLGNPPWERIKLQEKEWFATRYPDIANASNASVRRRLIESLATKDPELYQAFLEDRRKAEGESHLIRNSGRYPLCARGDINTYAIFSETMRLILAPTGRVGCIVPSGIATEDTTKHFFADLMQSNSLLSLFEFENEGYFDAGQGHMVRFALTTMVGTKISVQKTEFLFQGKEISEISEKDRCFKLDRSALDFLSPNTRTCPIFRTTRDADITKTIYHRVPILIHEGDTQKNPWEVKFLSMFHMTNDAHLFRTREQLEADGFLLVGNIFEKGDISYLPLYEAKMIHQFNHRFGDFGMVKGSNRSHVLPEVPITKLQDPSYESLPWYWVPAKEIAERLHGRWQYKWLLGWRDVTDARASARTAIFGIIPAVGVANSFPLLIPTRPTPQQVALLLGCLNSYIVDFLARQRIAGLHMNYHALKQLPILPPEIGDTKLPWDNRCSVSDWVADRILELSFTSYNLSEFGRDLGYEGPPFLWNVERRFHIRCELDAAYFHLYGIARNDVDYIMDTFPIVNHKEEEEFGEYRTKRVVLECYDAMKKAIDTGKPYQTILNPPPADPRVAHPSKSVGKRQINV